MTFSQPLTTEEILQLEKAMHEGQFEFRDVQHARFSARGEGVTCTVYNSGKCVIQGKGTEQFVQYHLSGHSCTQDPTPEELDFTTTVVGSDESGKGDYFGPLVAAAVVLDPADLGALEDVRLVDSKRLSPGAIVRTARVLRETVIHSIVTVMPSRYNDLYEKMGNLNRLLAWCHGAAIEEALGKKDASRVVIDRFCDEKMIRNHLKPLALSKELEIRPRAEDHPAVAAAAILATDEFRRRLGRLGDEAKLTLPRGSGAPVKRAARRLVQVNGQGILHRVAKIHFKITGEIAQS